MVFLRRFYSPDDTGGASSGKTDDGGAQSGSDDGDGGADTGGDGDEGGSGGGSGPKPINPDDHRRAIDDLNRYKRKAADEAKARAAIEAKLADTERKMKGEDIDSLRQRAEEAEREKETLKTRVITSEKRRALLPALTEAGFRSDATKIIDALDLDDLEVEFSTHGNISVHGIQDFVKKVKRDYPFAFEPKKAAKVNAGGSGGGSSGSREWTPASLVELELKCKKTGDMKPYNAAMTEYIEQKKAQK